MMLSSKQAVRRRSCDLNSFFFKLSTLHLQDLEFFGVMRFFFQDTTSKVATKCIRVASSATTQDVLDILIEKFRPDMRMLTLPNYSLYEVHANGGASFFKDTKLLSATLFEAFNYIYRRAKAGRQGATTDCAAQLGQGRPWGKVSFEEWRSEQSGKCRLLNRDWLLVARLTLPFWFYF